MDSKEGELSKFSPSTIMKISFWLTLIGAVVMLIALTNNSWAYQEDNGNTVTEVGLWKRCRHTLTSHSCSNIDFPYNNCSILLSSRNGLQDGIMPQCSRFRSTGGLAVVGCGLAVLAAVFIRSSTGNPGEKKLRNLCVTFGAAFVGLVAMSLWAQYFTDNFKLRTGGTGNFESGLGSGWMLMTAGWVLCAVAGLLILLFVPESDNKVAKHKVGLALVIGIISLLFCVVAFATPAWSQSEGDGGAGGPVSSAGVGLFQLCLVSRADGSTVCYNQNVRQCEWTESNSGINLQYRLTGCRAFQTVRGLQAIALICSTATVVLLVLIYRGATKWKAPALFLALIAALTGMVAMALYKGWSDENFPIAGSFGTQNFSIGYSFAFCIVGWVLMVLAAYFLYDGVADSNESLVDPPTAHKMGLYAGILCAVALLLVVIGLGLPYWAESVQEPSFKAHMGLYQYCWSQQGVQNDEICSPIDTGCATSSSSPAPTTVQLKECPRIQTVRAFTILSFLFGIVAAILAILGYTKDEMSKKTWAFVMCIVCAVQGFIAMAAWLGYFERNIEPGMGASLAFPNPGLSHSFGLHVAGVMLYCLAAVAAFVSMSGAPEAARPQSEAKQPGAEGEKV